MNKTTQLRPSGDNPTNFEFFLLSALSALLFFRVFLDVFSSGRPVTKDDDFTLYLIGWMFFPLLGLIFVRQLERKRHLSLIPTRYFYPVQVFLSGILLLFLLHPRHWGGHWLISACELFISFFSGFKISLWLKNNKSTFINFPDNFFYNCLPLFFFGWLITLSSDLSSLLTFWSSANILFFALFIIALHFQGNKTLNPIKPFVYLKTFFDTGWFLYFAVFIFIGFLIIDPNFKFNAFHSGYYLAPLTDLKAGKSLLVNINAQYGVLVYYFLGLFFKILPMGFTSFALILTVLTLIQYWLFFFTAKILLRSFSFSFLCLLTLLLINHFFAQKDFYVFLPSTGPLRFGFIYLLMFLVLLRNSRPQTAKFIFWIETFVAGTAFMWSLEVCLYTVPAYFATVIFETTKISRGSFKIDFSGLRKRALMFSGWVILFTFFIYLDIYQRAHQLPHWSYYFDYIFLYKGGYGMLPMPQMDYWWITIGILYFSFFGVLSVILKSKNGKIPEHFNVIVLLNFYGILQFIYYLGRAHPNNLLHVSMPCVLLGFYWLSFLRQKSPNSLPEGFKKWGFTLSIVLIGILLQPPFSLALERIKQKSFSLGELSRRIAMAARDQPRDERFSRQAEALMDQYSGKNPSLLYFFGERGVEFSIYTGRVKIYPYNDADQASICWTNLERIINFDPQLKKGDFIYLTQDLKGTFEEGLLRKTMRNYSLKPVLEKGEIFVYQIQ